MLQRIARLAVGLNLTVLSFNAPARAQTEAPAEAPAPAENPTPKAAPPGEATIAFVSDEPGLTVLKRPLGAGWRAGSPPSDADFSVVCVAPCRAQLDQNPYQFAVRRSDGRVLPGSLAYELKGPSTLRAQVVSRGSTRTQGSYVLGIVGGAGVVATTTALMITCGEDRECAKWTSIGFWGGLGALSVGALIGLPMITRKDELAISIAPGVPLPAPSSRLSLAPRDALAAAMQGLTISGRF